MNEAIRAQIEEHNMNNNKKLRNSQHHRRASYLSNNNEGSVEVNIREDPPEAAVEVIGAVYVEPKTIRPSNNIQDNKNKN